MSDVTGHNHDESGAPTYPDYRDRCPVGCDDLTPVRMADTNVQLVGKDRLVTRRLVLDGPSQFAMTTPPRTPTCCELACYEDPGCTCDGCHPDPAPLDVDRLARALHAASWGCESGPAQAADFIYHQRHAAEIAREYAALREDPTP